MAQAPSVPGPAAPWSERLFQAVPLSPFAMGAAVAAGVVGILVAVELGIGELPAFLRGEETIVSAEEYRFSLIFALLIGYLPAAYIHSVRSARRTWDELRPVLRLAPAEFEALRASAGRFSAASLRRAGWIGIAVAVAIPFLVDFSLSAYQIYWDRIHVQPAIHRVMLPMVGWLLGRNFHAVLADSSRLAQAGREHLALDLLDLGPLAPFTRHGLRNALLAMGNFAILSLLIVDLGTRPGLPLVFAFGFALAVALGVAGLLLPVRGAHAAIRRAKGEEIAACNEAIRARRAALAAAREGGGDGPSLQELLAWRGFVESVREWPFDASTFTRFLLYLAIPLGSWLGGAMVERLVDAALG